MASSKTRSATNGGPFLVVNPVFQNWCRDDGKKDKRGLVSAPRVHSNFAAKRVLENKILPKELPRKSSLDFKSTGVLKTNPIVLLLMVFVCLVSIAALVLTVMMFGKIGDRCGCPGTQGMLFV